MNIKKNLLKKLPLTFNKVSIKKINLNQTNNKCISIKKVNSELFSSQNFHKPISKIIIIE